jgi:hypothetical protein
MMYSQGRYVLADVTDYSRASGAVEWVRRDIGGGVVANDTLTDWTDWEVEVTKDDIIAGGKITFLARRTRAQSWSISITVQAECFTKRFAVWENGSNPTLYQSRISARRPG